MKSQVFLMMALGTLVAPTFAQRATTTDGPLVSNAEADSYAIAEQVYAQARVIQDSTARMPVMARAASLFENYARKFPKAANRDRALYLQAHCLAESGNLTASNEVLGKLSNNSHGEYAAAAAYKLATQSAARQLWEKAQGYYRIVVNESKRPELKNDAMYRLGRSHLQLGQRKEAEEMFRKLQVMQNVKPSIVQSSLLAIAQMKTEDGQDEEAYALFRNLLSQRGLDSRVKGVATLQAARLAARLGRNDESQDLYNQLSRMPGMEKYSGEAQMEGILALFRNKQYQEVVSRVSGKYIPMEDAAKEAQRALIVGQSYMEIKQYAPAIEWFKLAETSRPGTAMAADAGYRRIICVQQVRGMNFFTEAEKYINTYAKPGSATEKLPCMDLVRLMYADRLLLVDPGAAARQYHALNMEQLPEAVRPDALYKKAWCAAQGEAFDPLPTLDFFLSTYPHDLRTADALALRGSTLMKQNRREQALADFDRVVKDYPNSDAAAVAWQRAAQACAGVDAPRMIKYYEGLINYYREIVKRGGKDKPAAVAEAHYNIACALYDSDPAAAVPHFQEARTMNSAQYAPLVGLRLVQCYFKMKDGDKLLEALQELEKSNAASYNALPPAILRWCGWTCYQTNKYKEANKYLTDTLSREPVEKYTGPDGAEKVRPKVEPIVWKTLARSRLEIQQYQEGLVAAEHYVSLENQPYRKAEGMRDQALLLIGLKRAEEARKLCEEAIAIGVDGPIKSSLFITLGDAYYADKQYGEAAKYYGRTANVVSDKDLKPMALYKIVCALKKSDKAGEAEQYEQTLRADFPGWQPDVSTMMFMEEMQK